MELEDDCNLNGVPDACDIEFGASADCNGNGVPSECDLETGASSDCNSNGVSDDCDISWGTSFDHDENGVPDECQFTLQVPGDYATIQEAIDAAEPGDTVLVAGGVYTGPGNRSLDTRGKIVTVRGASGPENCIIDCENQSSGFSIFSGEQRSTRIEGLTITRAERAIDCRDSSPRIHNCFLRGNHAYFGAGMYTTGGAPLITNCLIAGNVAEDVGGGLHSYYSAPTIRNCVIAGNRAIEGSAGGIQVDFELASGEDRAIRIENCTVFGNQAGIYGAGLAVRHNPHVHIDSSIFWSHGATGIHGEGITASFCNFEDPREGEGNLSSAPLFVDPFGQDRVAGTGDEDLRLLPGSPCIDAGNPSVVPLPTNTDLDGHRRVLCGRVDVGAYESSVDRCEPFATLADFAFFKACLTGPGIVVPPVCVEADLSGDGRVDLVDFALFAPAYRGP
jgi:hypothetical protein